MMEGSQGSAAEVEVHEVVVEPTELRESGEVHRRAGSLLDLLEEQLEDEVRLGETRRNVVTWRLCDWNMVIEDDEEGSQHILLQILSSPLCPEAIAAIGVVLFGIWHGVDPYNISGLLFCCYFLWPSTYYPLQTKPLW